MATAMAITEAVEPVARAIEASLPPIVIEARPGRSWYAITQTKDEAEIKIYEDIGFFGISAKQFVDELEAITASRINLRLNTYGGEVFDGIAIYNALRAHPATVTVYVDGVAASAGSIVAMSGEEIRMAENAFLMIHEASSGVMGVADDMRHEAELLDKINDTIALTYQARAGKTRKYWRDKMSKETWFTAAEAKSEGLADVIDKATQPEARFDFKIYNNVPAAARETWGKPQNQKQISSAPEEPLRSDYPPQPPTERSMPMASDTTVSTAPPAQTPAAGSNGNSQGEVAELNQQAINNWIDHGRRLGIAEGVKAEQDRMRAIQAAAGGRADIAIQAFLAGQDEKTVAMIANVQAEAEAKAQQAANEQRVQIARLQAQIAAGGHPGVAMSVTSRDEPLAAPPGLEPEAQAKLEWEGDPLLRAKNNNNQKAWMLYRVNELKGNVRVLKTA